MPIHREPLCPMGGSCPPVSSLVPPSLAYFLRAPWPLDPWSKTISAWNLPAPLWCQGVGDEGGANYGTGCGELTVQLWGEEEVNDGTLGRGRN